MATLDGAAPKRACVLDEEASLVGSGLTVAAERVCGVTASGAGEPNEEGEGEPYAGGGASFVGCWGDY